MLADSDRLKHKGHPKITFVAPTCLKSLSFPLSLHLYKTTDQSKHKTLFTAHHPCTTAHYIPKTMTEQKLGFVPYIDTYIVVSLNAEATVDFYCNGLDDIARSEIQCLTFKKYVGYCADVRRLLFYDLRLSILSR